MVRSKQIRQKIISEINKNDGIDVYRLSTGDNNSTDPGSSYFSVVEKPNIAVLTEDGVNRIVSLPIAYSLAIKFVYHQDTAESNKLSVFF